MVDPPPDTLMKLAKLIVKYSPMQWPEIDGIIMSTLTQAIIVNKHDMGGVWGKYYEEHIAHLLVTLAVGMKSEGEQGFNEYANLVATVYGIEGQQIKPNDPRLQLPDKRCWECLATLKEPKPLSPVRRQAHEFLQEGKHFRSCSNHVR